MIKHYIFFLFVSFTMLEAKSIPMYEDCEEYYDSRGFYHNSCEAKTVNERNILNAIEQYTNIIQPGDGVTEKNDTKPTPTTTEPLPKEVNLKTKKENKKALKENSDFEFGKEK